MNPLGNKTPFLKRNFCHDIFWSYDKFISSPMNHQGTNIDSNVKYLSQKLLVSLRTDFFSFGPERFCSLLSIFTLGWGLVLTAILTNQSTYLDW